jgi:hypothetical protein
VENCLELLDTGYKYDLTQLTVLAFEILYPNRQRFHGFSIVNFYYFSFSHLNGFLSKGIGELNGIFLLITLKKFYKTCRQ